MVKTAVPPLVIYRNGDVNGGYNVLYRCAAYDRIKATKCVTIYGDI